MKGPFVPLSVSYRENDKMLGVEPLAELLFVRALAFCKEKFRDGHVGRRQLHRLAHDLEETYDVDGEVLAGQLVTVGLWCEVKDGWVIDGWADWNAIDASRAGTLGNHERWHVRRGVLEPDCPHCDRGDSGATPPDIAPESGQSSGPSQYRDRSDQETRAAEFEQWWADYPRKVGKQAAQRSYRKARQSASAEDLASGLGRSVNQWRRENRPMDKIPHGETWLNQGRWMDVYETPAGMDSNYRVDASGNRVMT